MRVVASTARLAPRIVLLITASCGHLSLSESSARPCVRVSSGASSTGARILEMRQEERASGAIPRVDSPLAWAVRGLGTNGSPEADEALSALLGYYLGEAIDEETLNEVAVRGSRMVEWLELHRRSSPCGWERFEGLLASEGLRERNYRVALDLIAKGQTLGMDDEGASLGDAKDVEDQ